ncbi:MAG: 3-dehydroquinate synthase [Coriobacteriia bacterium]|nr:3-dehydroquinate synthase [Coriobacteriia bacterium]
MPVETMRLHSNVRDYTVSLQSDAEFIGRLVEMPNRVFVIDENVWASHRQGVLAAVPESDVLVLPIAEGFKTLASVEEVWDRLLERSARRNMTLVSIGGGICQDVTGFAASTLYRGIGWIFLPTTLLAQADSCIGSKTSLNYRRFKNLLGTFFPPNEVHILASFLTTQDAADYFSGVGEVVKLHIMGGHESATGLVARFGDVRARDMAIMQEVIRDSLLIKQNYIAGDEFDTGRRNMLNYGHCFGHAVETASDFAVPHGQAVVLGMIMAQRLARTRGLETDAGQKALLDHLFREALLVERIPRDIDIDGVIEAMKHDKKRTGEGLVVVMAADGLEMVKHDDVSVNEAHCAATETLRNLLGRN